MSQSLWGVDIPLGGSVSATANAPASHSVLHLSSAVLVPDAGTVANAFADATFLLTASTDAHKSVVLASLGPSRPNVVLQHQTALKAGKLTLAVQAIGAQTTGYRVSVSGYTSTGAAAASASSKDAAAPVAQKRKSEETPTKAAAQAQPQAKKQKTDAAPQAKKAAPVEDDEDDMEDDEDDDEEEEAPSAAPAPKSKPTTPVTTPSKPEKPKIVTLKNGLKMQDTKIGAGKEATDKSAVGIRYRGSLASNGKVFDSNMPRGQPLRFKIGGGDVIAGFEQGTKGMRVGGTRTVVIPSHLGYGARGAPPDIPGGATLVFDLELVSVK